MDRLSKLDVFYHDRPLCGSVWRICGQFAGWLGKKNLWILRIVLWNLIICATNLENF